MTQKYNIAVAGATGAVGTEIVQILEQRDFPIDNLYLLASSKSKGKKVEFKDKEIVVEDLSEFDFSKAHIGLFSPGGKISAEYAPVLTVRVIIPHQKGSLKIGHKKLSLTNCGKKEERWCLLVALLVLVGCSSLSHVRASVPGEML